MKKQKYFYFLFINGKAESDYPGPGESEMGRDIGIQHLYKILVLLEFLFWWK